MKNHASYKIKLPQLNDLKIIIYTILFLFISELSNAQTPTWQWAKRGGTFDTINYGDWEQITAIETDANGNVYILAPVGINSLDIDGNPKATYGLYAGDGSATLDYVIASFDCAGVYRWSKVIGGQNSDKLNNIQLDAQGNVYAVGSVRNNSDNFFFPGLYPQVHFDNDVILPYAGTDIDENYQTLFIIKYNSEGVFQWLKMPQSPTASFLETNNAASINLAVSPSGNCFWFCYLGPGNYCDNQLIVANLGFYLLKYSSTGIYQSAEYLDFQVGAVAYGDYKFKRNFDMGINYISAFLPKTPGSPHTFIAQGQSVDFTRFVLAFSESDNNIWLKQNNTTLYWSPSTFDIALDEQNNIYLNGKAGTITPSNEPNAIMESFNGAQFPAPSSSSKLPIPYVIKLDGNGNNIWQTSGEEIGSITAQIRQFGLGINENKNEVAVVGAQAGLQWGGFSITQEAANGYDPYVARFDKTTGAVKGLHTFTSNNNTYDAATTITADNLGNYLVGGMFWQQVTIGPSILLNTGSQTDFFVAKLGTANCTLNLEKTLFKDLKVYPNPVKNFLFLDNQETVNFQMSNSLGAFIQKGSLPVGGKVDCSGLATGLYLLNLENADGEKKVVKVFKE